MKSWNWALLFYLVGFLASFGAGFAFYYVFSYIDCWVPDYTIPYTAKRVALSVSAGLATLQAYTDMLRFLFSRKPVPAGQDDRRWLVKVLQERLVVDDVARLKDLVTLLPPWFKFVILYLFAIFLGLL